MSQYLNGLQYGPSLKKKFSVVGKEFKCFNFQNGEKQGIGFTVLDNGASLFLGDYSGNLRNGYCFERKGDQSAYIGNYENGKHHGYGVEIDFQKGSIYEGDHSHGKKNGFGIFSQLKNSPIDSQVCLSGNLFSKKSNLLFKGEFENGNYQGMGYLKVGKRKIIGNFSKGKPNGTCICMDRSTRSIKFGNFKEGEISGYGIEITPNFIFKGKFKEGKASKLGVLTLRNKSASRNYDNKLMLATTLAGKLSKVRNSSRVVY